MVTAENKEPVELLIETVMVIFGKKMGPLERKGQ